MLPGLSLLSSSPTPLLQRQRAIEDTQALTSPTISWETDIRLPPPPPPALPEAPHLPVEVLWQHALKNNGSLASPITTPLPQSRKSPSSC